MKVISFKVNDDVYFALKKKNVNFRKIFEPIAMQLAQNNKDRDEYTLVYAKNSSSLYIDLCLIKKTIEKVIKLFDDEEKFNF